MPRTETRLDDPHVASPASPLFDLEFEDTVAFPEPPPADVDVWRDSSMDLEQGLDIDELPVDSLPGALRESFGG